MTGVCKSTTNIKQVKTGSYDLHTCFINSLPIDLQKELLLIYFDEHAIENLRKVCAGLNEFVQEKYKEIAFNIMKNKYDYKIYEYSAAQISILYGDGKCHSIIDNIGLLLAFLREHCH